MIGEPLEGLVVALDTDDPAAAICARHLRLLGAAIVAEREAGADVVLSDRPAALAQGLNVVFEQHRLGDGGLVASETTAQAAIGLADYVAAPGEAPARTGCDIGTSVAGFCAAQATLAWLHGGRAAGAQEIRVSAFRALSTLKTILWAARSRPDAWTGTHVTSRDRLVDSGYRTRDRRITLDFPVGAEAAWLGFVGELGLDAAAIERLRPRWYESVGWGDDVDAARPLYEQRLADLSSEEATALVRRNGGSSVPFQSPAECLAHPQAHAIGLADSIDGLPWRLDARGTRRVPGPSSPDPACPLAGVRVVDFGIGGVGPFGATLLAWLGADVVKVEAPNEFILSVRPTAGGLSTTYLALNQGKRSVALDLKSTADLELARRLVATADVVVENFRPGALARRGLGYDDVAGLNPSIVYCSATGFGADGPLRDEACTDPHMQAFSGFAALNAAPGSDDPRRVRYYGFVDLVTSTVIAEAVCAALLVRARHGGPIEVQTSMLQAVTAAQMSVERHALDGFFRTRDGYVAVTCRTAAERERLGDPELLAELTSAEAERALGARGLVCARALHDEEVLERTDLRDAGLLRELPLPHAEPLTAGGPPWRLPAAVPAPPAPAPGADTDALRAGADSFWASRALDTVF